MSEFFIPFYKSELNEYLCTIEEDEEKRKKLKEFCKITEAIYHFKYHEKLESIKNEYICYDPDSDKFMESIEKIRKNSSKKSKIEVIESIKEILKSGNYKEISNDELEKAFQGASPWGVDLDVDFDKYESFSIFYRGGYNEEKEKKILFFKKRYSYFVYSRVVFIFTLKEEKKDTILKSDKIYLKNFKNVPDLDLEMIFPETKVKIRLIDKLLVAVPLAIGVVSSMSKIIQYIVSSGTSFKLLQQIGFWTLMGGFFIFAIKSYFNYKNTVEKYLKILTQSLYLQNLDNNSGVYKNLIDDAEEQECKEIILAYYFLLREGNISEEELKNRVEEFFIKELKSSCKFEVEDAVRKLEEEKLVYKENGKLIAIEIDEALKRMDYKWDNYFKYNNSSFAVQFVL